MRRRFPGAKAIGLAIVLLAAAGGAAYLYFSSGADSGTAAESTPVASVKTALAAQGSLSPSAQAYGTVASAAGHTRILVMPHEGIIASVAVHDGDVVRAGQAIVTVAITPAAAAQFAQARSAVDFAQQDLARLQRLFADKLATNDQIATARKTLSDAQNQLDQQSKIGAGRAEDTVSAPFDGVVTGLSATPGDRPQMGAALATVASRSDLVVQLGLEPADAAMLMPGAAVHLVLPQDGAAPIAGRLTSVGAAIDPMTHLVKGIADIAATDMPGLALGTTLVAHIDLPARKGILVPRAALLEDAEGPYVFAVVAGKAHRQNVKIAVETDDRALLDSGVATGARVVVAGNAALDDGVALQEAKP